MKKQNLDTPNLSVDKSILSAFEKEEKHQARQVRICFSFDNMEGVRVEHKVYAAKLVKDWYGDCEYCPENDTILTTLVVGTTPISKTALEGFTFETLMTLIENTWTFNHFKGFLSKAELNELRG